MVLQSHLRYLLAANLATEGTNVPQGSYSQLWIQCRLDGHQANNFEHPRFWPVFAGKSAQLTAFAYLPSMAWHSLEDWGIYDLTATCRIPFCSLDTAWEGLSLNK